MAIQVYGVTVIDDSKNITNAGTFNGYSISSNVGSNAVGTRTVQSGGSASGGSDGDIYYIY